MLGVGAFGKVYKTTNRYDTSMRVAIKVLDKSKMEGHMEMLMDEIQTLNTLDHPNIVKYYETYNDNQFIYLVMEYVEGMPLYDKICKQSNNIFTEHTAAKYMKSLL